MAYNLSAKYRYRYNAGAENLFITLRPYLYVDDDQVIQLRFRSVGAPWPPGSMVAATASSYIQRPATRVDRAATAAFRRA